MNAKRAAMGCRRTLMLLVMGPGFRRDDDLLYGNMRQAPRRHGLLLIDKPKSLTSHEVVARVRRLAGQRQVGHTGTLDPMATGLLGLLLGAATRLEPYLSKMDKSYSGRVELGLATDTDDVTGQATARSEGPWPELEVAAEALKKKEGEGEQLPPAYSAIKVAGQRAYKAARAGKPLELAKRRVTAFKLEMTAYAPPFLDFTAHVSSGYYIRSLARDLGADLGLGGALAALRRESVGPWSVARAATLAELADWNDDDWRARLIPPAEALPHLSAITVNEKEARDFCQGKPIGLSENILDKGLIKVLNATGRADGPLKVLNAEGRLIGLGDMTNIATINPPCRPFLRPIRVLTGGLDAAQPLGKE